MSGTSPSAVQYRKRMRGIAAFFMIICAIGGLAVLVLALSNSETHTQTDLVGRAIIAIAGFFAALAAWNASRVGAILVIAVQLVTPIIGLLGLSELGVIDWLRSAAYIALATYMTKSAFLYVSACEAIPSDVEGNVVLRWIGKIISGSAAAFVGFGIAIVANGITTEVQEGTDISDAHLDWLKEKKFLLDDEEPLYFYIDGAFSIEEGGSLLTDRYVGGWSTVDGELSSNWIRLGEVCGVEERNEGSFFEDAVYYVFTPGEENWTELWLSIEGDKHHPFISELKSINTELMTSEVKKFCNEERAIDWVEVAAMNGISSDIVGPEEVKADQLAWLREKEYILDNETLISFFSYGIYEIEEGGVLLTDQYFGGWYIQDDEPSAWWGKLGEICSIDRLEETEAGRRVLYQVTALDKTGVDLALPKTGKSVQAMISKVLELNQAAATPEQEAACLAQLESASDD